MLCHIFFISCGTQKLLYQRIKREGLYGYQNHRMDGATLHQDINQKSDTNHYSYFGSLCRIVEIRDRYYNKRAKTDII